MLVDDLKLKGLDLSLDGADLILATDEELSNDQINFFIAMNLKSIPHIPYQEYALYLSQWYAYLQLQH